MSTDAKVITAEDTAIVIDLLANASDIDSTTLTPAIIDGPANGTLTANVDGTFTYTPNADWFGADSFTYRVRDEDLDSNLATVSINVTPVNDAPVAVDDAITTLEDTPLTFDARANDYDIEGDQLTAWLMAAPQHGQVLLNADGSFTYTPVANYNGADSFTYRVKDDELESNVATVDITVTSVNDTPQGTATTVTTLEDTPYVFMLADFGFTDPSDAPTNNFLAVKIATVPVAGSLTLSGAAVVAGHHIAETEIAAGLFQFTPAPDANGTGYASLGFQVQDDGGTDNGGVDLDPITRTMTIDVTPVNDAPVAVASSVTGVEDQPYVFSWSDFNITDIESDSTLSVVMSSLPIDGQLQLFDGVVWTVASIDQAITQVQIDAGALRFIPDTHESGVDGYATVGVGNLMQDYAQFTYRASDGELFSEIATVTIDIVPVADAPTLNLINAEGRYGATTELFRTGWETVSNRSSKPTLIKATELEGWTLVKALRPDDNDHGSDDDDVHGRTSAAGDTTAGMQEVEQRREQLPRKSGAADDHKHKHGHDDDDSKDRDSGKDVFEIWSSGDKMANASTGHDDDHKRGHNKDHDDGDDDDDDYKPYAIVYAAPGNGVNFLELNDAAGEGHQTIGIERTVTDRKSTRLNSSHTDISRMPSSA